MPAKLTPAETAAIRESQEPTRVLAARHGVSKNRVKEIRAESRAGASEDRGGRPPGYPKTGGRLPGTPNKRTVYARQIIEEHGADPVEMLAKTMNDEKVPLDLRTDCAKALLPYVYPKLSAVEVTGRDGDAVQVEHDSALLRMMREDDALVERVEALIIEQTAPARLERAMQPTYSPELPSVSET
jgi:hypothetical protein